MWKIDFLLTLIKNKMEHKCNLCDRSFSSEESLNQHNSSKHPIEKKKGKINLRKYFIFIILILMVIFSSFTIYSYMKKPGQYDDFAKCLTERGAVMYGNDFCSYTAKQLNFFGKSKKYLNYIKCVDNKALCDSKGVSITPTWEIDEESYSGVQTFEQLSALSECRI